MMVEIVCSDVLEWAETYTGEPFHAMLCDPPYELNFMSKGWDNTGIAFQPSTWAALAEYLLPGAWLMAFASSRGWHRLAVAVEDAGMVIQPSIFGWATGQSFPKSTRIDTQIDRAAGAEQEVVACNLPQFGINKTRVEHGYRPNLVKNGNITIPATPLARAWEGHRYGGQVLKNALEPIICAQKPWEGKRLGRIVETGAGALNVDGGRIGTDQHDSNQRPGTTKNSETQNQYWGWSQQKRGKLNGRWPPNFYLQHSPLCQARGTRRVKAEQHSGKLGTGKKSIFGMEMTGKTKCYADASGHETVSLFACEIRCQACDHVWIAEEREACPECGGAGEWACAVRKLDADVGKLRTGGRLVNTLGESTRSIYGGGFKRTQNNYANQVGGPSRFFKNPDWSLEVAETLAGADPVRYCAKASRAERDAGLDEFASCEVQTGCAGAFPTDDQGKTRDRFKATVRNPHCTVKPLSLNKWLATLLLPPPEYTPRRLLVPFGGVCSEAIGALLAGWEHITVIEMSQEYCDISKARVRFWQGWSERTGLMEPKVILGAARRGDDGRGVPEEQLSLF